MNKSERINGFDALRTIAMWLGILLHSIIVYKAVPEPNWPHDAQHNWYLLDWLYYYIHSFRMPLFFFVAGFFARMVIRRSGPRYFITQRFKRIVVPFVISVIVIVPVTLLPFHFYDHYNLGHATAREALLQSLRAMPHWNGLVHLWFLYYLIIFYLLSIAGWAVLGNIQLSAQQQHALGNITLVKLGIAALALGSLLYVYNTSQPPVYTGVKPNLLYLLYYGFFYGIGWLLQVNMQSIGSLTRYSRLLLAGGTLLAIFLFCTIATMPPAIGYFLTAFETIAVIAGATGVFVKYCHAESKTWRYFSDAAYWVYLVHMAVVSALQVALYNSSVPWVLRLPIVFCTALTISLLSYQLLVRYTVIGEFLHGKRTRPVKHAPLQPQSGLTEPA